MYAQDLPGLCPRSPGRRGRRAQAHMAELLLGEQLLGLGLGLGLGLLGAQLLGLGLGLGLSGELEEAVRPCAPCWLCAQVA